MIRPVLPPITSPSRPPRTAPPTPPIAVRETFLSPVLGSVTQAERLTSETAARLATSGCEVRMGLFSLIEAVRPGRFKQDLVRKTGLNMNGSRDSPHRRSSHRDLHLLARRGVPVSLVRR